MLHKWGRRPLWQSKLCNPEAYKAQILAGSCEKKDRWYDEAVLIWRCHHHSLGFWPLMETSLPAKGIQSKRSVVRYVEFVWFTCPPSFSSRELQLLQYVIWTWQFPNCHIIHYQTSLHGFRHQEHHQMLKKASDNCNYWSIAPDSSWMLITSQHPQWVSIRQK